MKLKNFLKENSIQFYLKNTRVKNIKIKERFIKKKIYQNQLDGKIILLVI